MKAYKTKDGVWQLSYMIDGRQRSLYLGKSQTAATAGRAERVLKDILLCRKIGESPSLETVRKFKELGPKVRASFERHGLVPDRGTSATVGDLIRLHEPTTSDKKSGTKKHYGIWYRELAKYFGNDKRLDEITKGDTELFRSWCLSGRSRSLSSASVSRGVRTCRTIFRFGVDSCLTTRNPFDGVRCGSDVNILRQEYIDRGRVMKIAEFCRTDEERFALLLARFAGLRIPCEIRYLRFGDFKDDRFRIHFETKTGPRDVPFFHELRPLFERLRKGRKDDEFIFTRNLVKDKTCWKRIKESLQRSGEKSWQKLFVNLRSSCITDFVMLGCNDKTLDSIFGNSSFVRYRHYVQFMKDHEIDRLLRDNLTVLEMLKDHGGQGDDLRKLEFRTREILADLARKNFLVKFFDLEKTGENESAS